MNTFKIGCIVKDRRNDSNTYKYGLVQKINGDQIYCLWANSLENLMNKIYVDVNILWADAYNLEVIFAKKVKPYGISDFMDGLNNRKR